MKRERGFTLVEIVVAFVLLSAVLMTGFEIFSQGLRRAGDLEDEARALVIAQSKLAAAGTEERFNDGSWQGQSEDGRFRWTLTIARTDEGSAGPGQPINNAYQLFRVDIRVEWTTLDSRTRSIELATLGLGSRI
ncbi:MAG TPA: prepilin-type N-terminal cleavage/methylation domain-containing protein [Usitatibacter sp.]|nr:prepilin-type N-terminal cleavage/methylation domain-containing protein [Usitatibacter sp.]